jgi:hypothetical protein
MKMRNPRKKSTQKSEMTLEEKSKADISAFLHADIDCEIYMRPLLGFKIKDKYSRDLVWNVKKAVYGLRLSFN